MCFRCPCRWIVFLAGLSFVIGRPGTISAQFGVSSDNADGSSGASQGIAVLGSFPASPSVVAERIISGGDNTHIEVDVTGETGVYYVFWKTNAQPWQAIFTGFGAPLTVTAPPGNVYTFTAIAEATKPPQFSHLRYSNPAEKSMIRDVGASVTGSTGRAGYNWTHQGGPAQPSLNGTVAIGDVSYSGPYAGTITTTQSDVEFDLQGTTKENGQPAPEDLIEMGSPQTVTADLTLDWDDEGFYEKHFSITATFAAGSYSSSHTVIGEKSLTFESDFVIPLGSFSAPPLTGFDLATSPNVLSLPKSKSRSYSREGATG